MTKDACAEVHLWHLVSGTGALGSDPAFLSAMETARAAEYRRGQDLFVFFRSALRRILGGYLALPPAEVPLSAERYEKPRVLPRGRAQELHFNLTHSGSQGLLAVCRSVSVGVDLEVARPVADADRLAARFFSPKERAAYGCLPAEQRTLAFLRCWTRKEAYLKATGAGLSFPLEKFSVSLSADEPARLIEVDDDPAAALGWCLRDCDPAADCVAALVVAAPTATVVWRDASAEIAVDAGF
jgi:4'-phosphopantetheinyl transferase